MQTTTELLSPGTDVPNHPRWPVIVYHGVVDPRAGDTAEAFEALFASHGWGDGWRNGIFPYHHYHPHGHEVLGIASGHVTVKLGGEAGEELRLTAGDAVLLPAGTGHKRLLASPDLLVIGAYPPGQSAEIRRAGEGDIAIQAAHVRKVKKPDTDPVGGADGPAIRLWRA